MHGPRGHTWHHADGQLAEVILGSVDFPWKTTPPFEGVLSRLEVMDVVAYLKTGWEPEQLELQERASNQWRRLQGAE